MGFRELSAMRLHRRPLFRILSTCASLLVLGVLGTLPSQPAHAADAPKLESIDVTPLPGQQLQLTMRLPRPAPQPLSCTVDNPARISFDLPNTELALPSRRIDVHTAGLDSILAAEAKDRARLVLNLDKLVPYDTRVDGNNIVVLLGAPNPVGSTVAGASNASAAPTRLGASSNGTRELRGIDFRRGADGAGRVIVKLSDPHIHINLHQVGNQIVVDFDDADVSTQYLRRYDATDFGTPV